MMIRVTFAADDDILVFAVAGVAEGYAERLDLWNKINEHARSVGFRKMLMLDERDGSPASQDELENLVAFCSQREFLADALAIVVKDSAWMPNLELAEIIGRAKGLNMRVFGDVATAKYWLRYESDDAPGMEG